MTRLVSTQDIAAAAAVSYRRVDHWVRVGVLRVAAPCCGSGVRRRFHPDEIQVARVAAALFALGADHDLVRPIAEAVRAHPNSGRTTVHTGLYVVDVTKYAVTVTAPLPYGERRATA